MTGTGPGAGVPGGVRAVSALLGAGRIAIGIGLAAAPDRTLGALGLRSEHRETVIVSRIAGVRDLVLGAATLLSLSDPERLRRANLASAAADGGDAVTFLTELVRAPRTTRAAAIRGVAAATPAALAGAWAAARLAGPRPAGE